MTDLERVIYHNWQIKNNIIKGEIFTNVEDYLNWYNGFKQDKWRTFKKKTNVVFRTDTQVCNDIEEIESFDNKDMYWDEKVNYSKSYELEELILRDKQRERWFIK